MVKNEHSAVLFHNYDPVFLVFMSNFHRKRNCQDLHATITSCNIDKDINIFQTLTCNFWHTIKLMPTYPQVRKNNNQEARIRHDPGTLPSFQYQLDFERVLENDLSVIKHIPYMYFMYKFC